MLLKSLGRGLVKTREAIGNSLGSIFTRGREVREILDDLEEALIGADIGVETTMEIIERIRKDLRKGKGLEEKAKEKMREVFLEILRPLQEPLEITRKPYCIMVAGVNGVGKTTLIGKLAYRLREEGNKVILGAADTFRAAAIEQLEEWGRRASSEVIKHQEGSDPAAVAFDTMKASISRGADIVIVDTGGRLHTKTNLMEELKKVKRVIGKALPGAPHEVLLVIDATTGQNALQQAISFHRELGITGIAITKLDGTAKGGILIAIGKELKAPIRFVGIGEGIHDVIDFDAEGFVEALLE